MVLRIISGIVLLLFHSFLWAGPRSIDATKMNPPTIDGVIDPIEWAAAYLDSGFTQLEPDKGAAATEKTMIRTGMDHTHLYVAVQCLTKDINTLTAGNLKRDKNATTEDGFILILDTFHDLRSAYVFHINLLNTQGDVRIESNGSNLDTNWDTEWRSATSRSESGWSAELAIPFNQIKFSPGQVWGVNFGRLIARNQEIAWWSGTLDDMYRISQNGELHLAVAPRLRKPIQLIPYVAERYDEYRSRESVNDWSGDIGLDAELPFTSDLSANVTINPDFASVEGDKEQLNLYLWEIDHPEKRPFFRDVNALMSTRIGLFYSRRIGDIEHGEKIAGKLGPFQAVGLYARTCGYHADGIDIPKAHFSAIRLQKDILSASTLGITFVDKTFAAGYHRALGIDTNLRLPYDLYVTSQFVGSWPGTNLWDRAGGFIRVARENNLYHYHLRFTSYGKDFRENINETGYLQYDDVKELDGDISYNFFLQDHYIKSIKLGSKNKADWHQDNTLWRTRFSNSAELYLTNRWSMDAEIIAEYRKGAQNENFQSYRIEAGYNTQEWSFVEGGVEWGDSFTFPFTLWTLETQFKLFRKMGVGYELNDLQYQGDADASTIIHVLNADFYMTPDLFLQIFSQYRSNIKRMYVYGKFGYRFRPPNSAIYITYTADHEEQGLHITDVPTNRILYVKLSHAFSL